METAFLAVLYDVGTSVEAAVARVRSAVEVYTALHGHPPPLVRLDLGHRWYHPGAWWWEPHWEGVAILVHRQRVCPLKLRAGSHRRKLLLRATLPPVAAGPARTVGPICVCAQGLDAALRNQVTRVASWTCHALLRCSRSWAAWWASCC